MNLRTTKVSFSSDNYGQAASESKPYHPQLPPPGAVGCTQPHPTPRWQQLLHRLLPPVLAVLFGAILIVVRPASDLSGDTQYGFLLLVIQTLFFFAGENTFGRHLQITVIGIVGATVGICWSALATELGCIANRRAGREGSIGARVAPAVFLAAISFACAFGKSKYARLNTGFTLAIFVSIWLISAGVVELKVCSRLFHSVGTCLRFARSMLGHSWACYIQPCSQLERPFWP